MRAISLMLAFLVAGCDSLPTRVADSSIEETQSVDGVAAQIGRFQFHPASGEFPAVVFDTATGCIEMLEKFTLEDKPNEVVWIRSVSDEVREGTSKRCNVKRSRYNPTTGKIEPIDGSKPAVSDR